MRPQPQSFKANRAKPGTPAFVTAKSRRQSPCRAPLKDVSPRIAEVCGCRVFRRYRARKTRLERRAKAHNHARARTDQERDNLSVGADDPRAARPSRMLRK